MDDLNSEMDLLTRRTEEMPWDTRQAHISLNMEMAAQISSTVLIGKIIRLKPPGKSIIINTILTIWKLLLTWK